MSNECHICKGFHGCLWFMLNFIRPNKGVKSIYVSSMDVEDQSSQKNEPRERKNPQIEENL